MLKLAHLYGVSVDEILNGQRAEKKENKKNTDEGRVGYLLLCIFSMISFGLGILLFVFFNFVENLFPGLLFLSIFGLIGGTLYVCSFIPKVEQRSLLVSSSVLCHIGVSYFLLGLACCGYLGNLNSVTLEADLFFLYTIFMIAPNVIAFGICLHRISIFGLLVKEAVGAYGYKIVAYWLLGAGLYFLIKDVPALAYPNSGTGINWSWLIGCSFLAVIGIVFGLLGRKRPLLSLIVSSLAALFGFLFLVTNLNTVYDVTVYQIEGVGLLLNCLIYITLSAFSFRLNKVKKQ
ncbi:MAG: hypothetical protein Q4F15_01375 [Bacillota bacterium]|nr:hypothetical protein [Bacillota bacterium]